jgi:putative ABC transport system permease protein
MVFVNSMNTVSLAEECFELEFKRGESYIIARRTTFNSTTFIPQTNSLFAVELIAPPRIMTGKILSCVDLNVSVRYQILVM